jgi:hypothetical protein
MVVLLVAVATQDGTAATTLPALVQLTMSVEERMQSMQLVPISVPVCPSL